MVFTAETHYPIPNKDILSWTFDDLNYDQDKPIYIDAKNPSNSISARQARVIIRKLVAGFHAAGLKKGDCVCISSFNNINYPIAFLGIIAAGGIYTGSNPSYTVFELIHHIKISRSKFFIVEPELLPNVLAASKECNIPQSNIWIFDNLGQGIPAGFRSWRQLMNHGEKDWVRFNDEKTSKETTAARLFSSGTTGLPKATIISHHNLIAEHTLVVEYKTKPWDVVKVCMLPMFHASCVPSAHIAPLRSSHTAYVMRRFELEPFLSIVQRFKINEVSIVPPIVIAIIMSPISKKYDLRSLRLGYVGAAPLDKDAQKKFQVLMAHNATFTQVWGMTETSCVASMFQWEEDDDTGSIGHFVPNVDTKIVNDDGDDITDFNTPGELCIRGPIVISGYFENPAANAASFDADGFFKTGDIVYRDKATKKWYIIDRKKELIKVRGFQVAPPEIEAVLLAHPLIVDAAVIGISTKDGGEQPSAYVVRRPGEGAGLTEEEVKTWCAKRLAKYKELTGGVRFLDAIPKNASGKILKRILREGTKKEMEVGKARL